MLEKLTPGRNGFLCREIAIMLVVGMAIRYLVGIFLTYSDDVQSWALTISNFEAGGGLYDIAGYYYAPPWGYILGFISVIGEFFGIGTFGTRLIEALPAEQYSEWVAESLVPSLEFALMVKTAFFISDILVGYIVYRIIMDRTGDQRKSVIGFGLWFLCPFVITAGAAQGMFDTISALLTLLCIYMVMKDRCFIAGMLMSTAVFLKLFPGFLIFVLIGYIILKHRSDGTWKILLIKAATGILIMTGVIFAPQILEGTISESFSFLTSRTETMGTGLGPIVSYLTVIAYLAILIASMVLGNITRLSKSRDYDGVLLAMLLVNITVVFLYPSSAQYLVLLMPLLAFQFLMVSDRYRNPMILLMIGVTMFALSRNAVNLLTVAGYTDLVSVEDVVTMIEWFQQPIILSFSATDILHIGGVIEYAGILWILYVFYDLHRKGLSGLEDDVSAKSR